MGRLPIQLQKKAGVNKKASSGKKVSVVKAKEDESSHVSAGKSNSSGTSNRDASGKAALERAEKARSASASKAIDVKGKSGGTTTSSSSSSGSSSGKKTAKSKAPKEHPVERGDIFRVQTTRDSNW